MQKFKFISTLLSAIFMPIRRNGVFFVFMYVLGVACAWLTLPHAKHAAVYENLYAELFLDLYVLCAALLLLPHKVRRWVRGVVAVLLYAIAIVDVYCFWKFNSTLTPTMLLLVGETNSREAAEFVGTYLSPEVLLSPVGWVLLIALVHAFNKYILKLLRRVPVWIKIRTWASCRHVVAVRAWLRPCLGLLTAVLLVVAASYSWHNKAGMKKLFTGNHIGEVEHTLTEKDHAVLYLPVYRLWFSVYANSLAAKQVKQLIATAGQVQVDSCSYTSPCIVLVIGESYGRHHSQLYGYEIENNPRQVAREKNGSLVTFSDVVSCWNLTSFVFKELFSLHTVGDAGAWCDYPLFPELFRKAGYHVTFLTNQFLPQAKEAVYDFSGGFFLNHPELSKAQFDARNKRLHVFDEGLLKEYDDMETDVSKPRLVIFHLMGQHVNYRQRSPNRQKKFTADSFKDLRPDLDKRQRKVLSDYDNAVLYNDSIVDQICRRFEKQDAIVLYLPDHGEECYEEQRGFICRQHSAAIDYKLAHYEFEIPMWVWASRKYAAARPEIMKQITKAKHQPFMTDALPHLLLYLAGIHTPFYQDKYNLFSPQYDAARPRILKGTTDYNKLTPTK